MAADSVTPSRVLGKIDGDDRLRNALEEAVEHQREHADSDRWQEYDHVGIEPGDLPIEGWELHQLATTGILEKTYDSNSSTAYRVTNLETAETALRLSMDVPDQMVEGDAGSEEAPDPEELFQDVVGHEDKKRWFRRTIANDAQVHHLLVGEPGSGKSSIVDDILDLPGAVLVVGAGSQSSAAGVVETLVGDRPEHLVVEELEKMSKSDAEALLTLCGNGYVKQSKADGRSSERIELDTTVFATANVLSKVSPESLQDRLMVWEFDRYTWEEFREICLTVLPRDHDVEADLAEEIAHGVYEVMDSTDVREAVRVAQLAETGDDVDELVHALGGGGR